MAKKKKTRVELRKNRSQPPRDRGWTRGFDDHGYENESTLGQERVRAKGDLSRKRTIIQDETPHGTEQSEMPTADRATCVPGRVLRVHGLVSVVQTEDGREVRCAIRRVLKNLATDERNVIATGDRVWIHPTMEGEGVIERVEPRHGCLTRASRKREHVLVANVDQLVIVMALVEPEVKPNLIDRYLASAEQGGIAPILCLNKADLVDRAECQPLVGFYSQLGIPTLLTSAVTGMGMDRLRKLLKDRQTVFSGQSGVGKSSLLNTLQPDLGLHVRAVSDVNDKGKHTTTTTSLLRLDFGGWVVDTPGIRQFELWDIIPEEVEGFFPEFRPYVHLCGFPDCSHTHEDNCAVKNAAALRYISQARYISYLGMYSGRMDERADEE
ncbi:MAG TPA: ribosome small subunit-dependent GTPase A [Gemmataceae bacterium]|nr:ribosome small subunit-dependent GTPase A [Gemmataceae bacterium]